MCGGRNRAGPANGVGFARRLQRHDGQVARRLLDVCRTEAALRARQESLCGERAGVGCTSGCRPILAWNHPHKRVLSRETARARVVVQMVHEGLALMYAHAVDERETKCISRVARRGGG